MTTASHLLKVAMRCYDLSLTEAEIDRGESDTLCGYLADMSVAILDNIEDEKSKELASKAYWNYVFLIEGE